MRDVNAAGLGEVLIAVVEPVDLLVGLGLWLAMLLLVAGLGWWARGGVASEPRDELPPSSERGVRVRRQRPLRTGTIHAPGVHVPADETVVIDTREVPR